MGDDHFAYIFIEFRVCFMDVYCLFGLTGNLRLFLIYNFELVYVWEWMAFRGTMLIDGGVGPFLTMFFNPVGECPRGLSNVRGLAVWFSA